MIITKKRNCNNQKTKFKFHRQFIPAAAGCVNKKVRIRGGVRLTYPRNQSRRDING